MRSRHGSSFVLSVVVAFASRTVAAQAPADDATRAAARQLGVQGVEAYWAHDYVAANVSLEKAYRLFATPTLALYSARVRANLGQLVEAAERYRETERISDAVGDSGAQKQAQKDAANELAELQPRIPTLTIELDAPASQVALSLDGIAISGELVGVGRPTNPGEHRVLAVLGAEHREIQVQLAEREHKVVRFQLSKLLATAANASAPANVTEAPAPAPHEAASSILVPVAITALALGGAGLATWGITGLVAMGKCSGGDCATASDKSSYNTWRTVSEISFIAGAALTVGGVATWLLAPAPREEQAGLHLDIAPTGVTLRGVF